MMCQMLLGYLKMMGISGGWAYHHDSTGYSPYYLMFGRHPRLPVGLIFDCLATNKPFDYTEYVQTLHDSLTEAYALANQTSHNAKDQRK